MTTLQGLSTGVMAGASGKGKTGYGKGEKSKGGEHSTHSIHPLDQMKKLLVD